MVSTSTTCETTAGAARLCLPQSQRTTLVLKLLDSLGHRPSGNPKQLEQAWFEETNRRYEAFLAADEQAIPVEQVYAVLGAADH